MTTVLCQHPIDNRQKALLCNEFPHCRFIFSRKSSHDGLILGHLHLSEVFFGADLTKKQLDEAPHLRWVQSPVPDLRRLPLEAIEEREDILLTATPSSGSEKVAEYVLAAVLQYAKCFPFWMENKGERERILQSKKKSEVWSLNGKIFLQVGLGVIGTAVAQKMQSMGMRVRAVHHNRSYNPHVDRILPDKDLHSLLASADVVSLSLPYALRYQNSFGKDEMSLMKEGAILVVTGSEGVVDETALVEFVQKGKFRGVVFDAVNALSLAKTSPLWKEKDVLLTPGIAHLPDESNFQAFRVFRANLRHYLPGNYTDMRGKVDIHLWNCSASSGRKTF